MNFFPINSVSLGRTIKLLRVSFGLKQKDLAQKLEVSTNYLSLVENDKREPSVSFLRDLASTLNVPLGFLFLDLEDDISKLKPEERLIFMRIKDLIWEIEKIRTSGAS